MAEFKKGPWDGRPADDCFDPFVHVFARPKLETHLKDIAEKKETMTVPHHVYERQQNGDYMYRGIRTD